MPSAVIAGNGSSVIPSFPDWDGIPQKHNGRDLGVQNAILFISLFYIRACTITHCSNGFRHQFTFDLKISDSRSSMHRTAAWTPFLLSWNFVLDSLRRFAARISVLSNTLPFVCTGPKRSNTCISTDSVNGLLNVDSSDCTISDVSAITVSDDWCLFCHGAVAVYMVRQK